MKHHLPLLSALLLAIAGPTLAAEPWGLENEKVVQIEGEVVDLACAVAGDCVAGCGGGKRQLGLVTVAADEIDWEDDVRIAIEERASLSPDALTGMEASLRFVGAESGDSKIFARLSAWQNWIFQRPNAVGPQGALTKYGQPDRAQYGWTRC